MRRVDVVSEGGFIKKGALVKIIKVEGSRIVVREYRRFREKLNKRGIIMEITAGSALLLIAVVLGIIILAVLFTFVPVMLWISALAAGVRVSIFTLIGMRLRRVIPSRVINPLIKAHKAGIAVTTNQLESHYLAGGNVDRVVNALIAAHRANIELTFERCAAIDLAGRDVLEAVQMSVNPKVIETPFIAGVAMNGIEVKAKARITVRANIDRLSRWCW